VGSSANCAVPVTVLNTIVAESLNELLDSIEAQMKQRKKFEEAAMAVVRSLLKQSRPIRFLGNNYSAAWEKEAAKRKLPNIKQSFHSLSAWTAPQTIEVFQGVLTAQELQSRYEIMVENYSKTLNIQTNLMIDMFRTQILPAALKHQKMVADSITSVSGYSKPKAQIALLQEITSTIEEAMKKVDHLAQLRQQAIGLHGYAQGKLYCDKVAPACDETRKAVDCLETLIDDELWPIPKYRELLFLI
jgi:glutamine synthetase